MPLIEYQAHNFRKQARLLIDIANSIIAEYQADGYDLTLRQLYYQFVARGIIQNSQKEYDKLGVVVSKARLAGLIDWDAIIDRTRTTEGNTHFDSPGDILSVAADQYKLNTRATQETYIEVWVEKEALVGVIARAANPLDVGYMSCRGYVSQSAMYRAAQRFIAQTVEKCVLLHLGDHDPSGIDMSRDIQDRLTMFNADVEVKRIALNEEQVRQYSPPPNPAKTTDSRYDSYIRRYGDESWELDALDPKVISVLIDDAVAEYTDEERWQELIQLEQEHKKRLAYISDHWGEIEGNDNGAEN